MKKFVQIYNGKAHWIFESEEMPQFALDIILVDITSNNEVQEGWDYNSETGLFTPHIEVPIVPIIQPTNQEVMDMQMTIMDLVVGVLENQMGGL